MPIRPSLRALASASALAALAACAESPVAPAAAPAAGPSRLLAAGEGVRTIVDSTDARGNHLMVAEYAAGVYADTARNGGSAVASVTTRMSIPATAGSSGGCITSTIDRTETQTGWAASVRKPGGCDREIVVALGNASTGERAQFSFLVVAGKTRIDSGLSR